MLKLTYTETGAPLECLAQSLEEWVARRVILALRVGDSVCLEPSTASFLLPADLPEIPLLQAAVALETTEAIALCVSDAEYIEVSLRGTWLAADNQSAEGVFVAALSERTEFFLFKLAQHSLACTSSVKQ